MIFVTVGGQLPFDRLIAAVDAWAGARGRTDVEAQIGDARFEPVQITHHRFLAPGDFRKKAEQADLIVGHAGMGTILLALELGKPIVVMPRRASLGEHRNDHQQATARALAGSVAVAADERELVALLDDHTSLASRHSISTTAAPELIRRIRKAAFAE